MQFDIGHTVGDYTITGILTGSGDRVYKVEHLLTQRVEAMKVLSADSASDVQMKRFEREIRALAKLNHPNIAVLHNAVHTADGLILMMECAEGIMLSELLALGDMSQETGIAYLKQVLAALAYAHGQGVVHRDVTPSNIVVKTDGQAKLANFGLSKSHGDSLLTNCGEILGSLPYMAPELVKGATQTDPRLDVYSVGVILYEHLTGRKPFGNDRKLSSVLTDSEPDPLPPCQLRAGLSREWDEILQRALARNPAHRYQSADDFLSAIASVGAPAAAALPRLRPLGLAIAIGASVVLAMVASPRFLLFSDVPRFSDVPQVRLARPPHIAPPSFATLKTPRFPQPSPQSEGKLEQPLHASANRPISPGSSAVEEGNTRPLEPTAQAPSADSPAVGQSAAMPATSNVVTADTARDGVSDSPAPESKRGFWGKLSPFRKKRHEKQEAVSGSQGFK